MEQVIYKANVVYAIRTGVLLICSIIDTYLLFSLFVLGHLNGKNVFFDITPFVLFLTFWVAVGGYLFWGMPYKVEKNEKTFTFFLLGKIVGFTFDKSELLKCGNDRFGKKVLYFKKKYRSYAIYESMYPEVFKIMKEIYLEKPSDSDLKKVPAN